MSRLLATTLLVAGLLTAATAAGAQSDALEIDTVDAADYPTIELTVTVPESLGGVALPPDAFAISEDGEPRGRPSLGQGPVADQPAAPRTVLAIDTSGSMDGTPIQNARGAAADFVDSLRPGSEVAIVTFGDRTNVVSDFTSDVGALRNAIASITVDPAADTALFDGVRRANRLLARVPDDVPQSIVLLADGENSAGRSTLDDAVADLERSGVKLWAVGLESPLGDLGALNELAGADGVLTAANAGELKDIYESLASDVSRRYALRYESQASGETMVTVNLDVGTVSASRSVRTDIEGSPAPAGPARTPQRAVTTSPYTVSVPLLGTTAAYRAGLVLLVLAGALLVWTLASGPSRARSHQLLPTARSERREGLTVVAEWVTSQADQRLRGRQLGGRIDRALEDAGLDVRTGEFVVGVLSMMVVAYALGLAVAGPLIGVVLTLVPLIAARLVLSILRDRRQAAFAEQFIDVLQLLAGSLRAGYGMLQGIDVIARDSEEPASSEFRRILLEHRLGRDLTEAMNNCADRMGNADFRWVVQAISIHREVGGDLARVLDNVVGTVRERAAVARQVRAMSAEGRLSARVLTALPFVVLLVISIIDPTYFDELTSRTIGWVLLGIAGTMLLIGTFVVHRMVKVQY